MYLFTYIIHIFCKAVNLQQVPFLHCDHGVQGVRRVQGYHSCLPYQGVHWNQKDPITTRKTFALNACTRMLLICTVLYTVHTVLCIYCLFMVCICIMVCCVAYTRSSGAIGSSGSLFTSRSLKHFNMKKIQAKVFASFCFTIMWIVVCVVYLYLT